MKAGKTLKIIIIAIVSVGAIAGGLIGLRKVLHEDSESTVIYVTRKETYENVIEVSGTVAAAQKQTLQALSAGTVLGVYVNAGDRVKKGDAIIQLDDTTEQYNLERHDYDMATARINGSAKEIKLLATQRLSLLQKIADRKVVATFDGVIADLDVAVGASLEAKDSVGTIVNIDYLTAEVEVAETDVSKLKIGQPVILKFPAYTKSSVTGYVTSWPAIGEITSRGATIVKVKIRIDDYPPEILPNFSFVGKIQIEEPVDYLVVERYAIGYENKEAYVELAKTGERKPVKVQPYGRDYVKILEGLSIKGGDELKQLVTPPKSGQNKGKNGNKLSGQSGPVIGNMNMGNMGGRSR